MSSGPENEVAKAAIKDALEEHLALMRTAIAQARVQPSKAVDDYIRALVATGAHKRLAWAVRAEMTGDVSRPRPPTAEEMQRQKEKAEKQRRENPSKNLTLLEKQAISGKARRLGRALTPEEWQATLAEARQRHRESLKQVLKSEIGNS